MLPSLSRSAATCSQSRLGDPVAPVKTVVVYWLGIQGQGDRIAAGEHVAHLLG